MTVHELVKIDAKKVRSNSDLLAFYIESFKSMFGKTPNCVGCTFKTDFAKLKKAIENKEESKKYITMEKQEITFKLDKRQGKILSYKKGGRTIRQYDNKMTEDFAVEYLTNGTKEELETRKKLFKNLPSAILTKEEKKVKKEEPKKVEPVKITDDGNGNTVKVFEGVPTGEEKLQVPKKKGGRPAKKK